MLFLSFVGACRWNCALFLVVLFALSAKVSLLLSHYVVSVCVCAFNVVLTVSLPFGVPFWDDFWSVV